jgi:hypothetical protein
VEIDEPKGNTRGVTFDTKLMCSCAESSALQVCDYKVKVMIAEPKGKRGRRDPLFSEAFAHAMQQPGLDYGSPNPASYSTIGELLGPLYPETFMHPFACKGT